MRSPHLPLLTLALAVSLAPSAASAADAGGLEVDILVDGRPLARHTARGTTYIEALAGREYSVRLSNRSGGRVAVALAVDGLGSIDARSGSAREAAKWVLAPWQEITVDGSKSALS